MQKKMKYRSFLLIAALFVSAGFPVLSQQAVPTSQSNVEAMQKIEDQWSEALAKRDQYALEMVLSPQFVDISADGEVQSRNQEIANILTRFPDLISLQQKVVSVRIVGEVAVVNGTYILRHRVSGHPVDEKGVFSHVYQRVRANWQCINAQRTIVVEEGVDKPKAAARRSPAELPFHVPLVHKGGDPAPAQPEASSAGTNPQ